MSELPFIETLPPLMKKTEVAALLRCSTRTVSRLITVGRLRSFRLNEGAGSGRQLIPRGEVERLLREAEGE